MLGNIGASTKVLSGSLEDVVEAFSAGNISPEVADLLIWGKRLADDVLALTREGCPGVDYWDWHIDNFDGAPAAWYGAIPVKLMSNAPHLKLVLF